MRERRTVVRERQWNEQGEGEREVGEEVEREESNR